MDIQSNKFNSLVFVAIEKIQQIEDMHAQDINNMTSTLARDQLLITSNTKNLGKRKRERALSEFSNKKQKTQENDEESPYVTDKEKSKIKSAIYYQQNKERIKAQVVSYQKANVEKIRLKNAEKYLLHKKEINTLHFDYNQKNKEKVRKRNATNKVKIKEQNAKQYLSTKNKAQAILEGYKVLMSTCMDQMPVKWSYHQNDFSFAETGMVSSALDYINNTIIELSKSRFGMRDIDYNKIQIKMANVDEIIAEFVKKVDLENVTERKKRTNLLRQKSRKIIQLNQCNLILGLNFLFDQVNWLFIHEQVLTPDHLNKKSSVEEITKKVEIIKKLIENVGNNS